MSPQSSLRAAMSAVLSEDELQTMVIGYATARGWLVHHSRRVATEGGYKTPIQGHPGYVDLTMARRGRLVLAELKAARGRLSPAQKHWRDALELTFLDGVIEYHLWRPIDWYDGTIKKVLNKSQAVQ